MALVVHRTTLETRYGVGGSGFDPDVWLIDPDLSALAGVPSKYWKVSGNAIVEMSASEKTAQDAAILESVKASRIGYLDGKVRGYIYEHYEPHRQSSFTTLFSEAGMQQWWNRLYYVGSGINWVKTVIWWYYTAAYQIMSCSTPAEVEALDWDMPNVVPPGETDTLDELDPYITIQAAIAIVETPRVTSALTAAGTINVAFTTYTITGEGAPRAPTSFNATGLPAGLSVNTSTGAITGTPTESGTFNVSISATNSAGTDTKTLVITIAAS